MKTFYFTKDITDFSETIAHVYEHLLLESLDKYLFDHGVDLGVGGYTGGETFRNVMFVEMWTYSERVARLVQAFMNSEKLDYNLLDRSLLSCATEDREIWQVDDRNLLIEEIEKLKKIKWLPIHKVKPYLYHAGEQNQDTLIKKTKQAKHYRTQVISIYLENPSLEDTILFARLSVILRDIVSRQYRAIGWYQLDTHMPIQKDTYLFTVLSGIIAKGVIGAKQLEDKLEEKLHSYLSRKNFRYIRDHLREYPRQKTWISDPGVRLHFIDAVFSNADTARMSYKQVADMMSRLHVRVEAVPYEFAKNLKY